MNLIFPAEKGHSDRRGEALAVSVSTGFPRDINDAGMSVVTVTDDNAERAKQVTIKYSMKLGQIRRNSSMRLSL